MTGIVIVGSGEAAVQAAAVAVTLGMDVTIIETEERILKRVTTGEMSSYYHRLHTERGVNIIVGTSVLGFEGDGHVESVISDKGRHAADIVIVGVGAIPNTEIAESAGIECDNGIFVDEHCQTLVNDIYAAGDCTYHPGAILKRRLRLESVPNATDQARTAANNMLGGDKVYRHIPWFWSDQYDVKLQMVGMSSDGNESVMRGDKSVNKFANYHLREGRLVAVDVVNSPKDFMFCKRYYGKCIDASLLGDASVDLKSLVA